MSSRVPDRDRPASPDSPASAAAPPRSVVVVAAAAVLEAVALVALTGWGVVQLVTGRQNAVGVVLFLVVFGLAVAAVLVGSARALWEGRRTGRAPVATWQLLQGATALAVLQATGSPVAWAVLVLSAVVFVLLLTRPVVAHTVPR
ncbi:hypothetical protein [Actinotalea ferrariae]|uniref:hypothetical protein n=1 Tax=Actinotalea ferrariae TaxID=1386098 RepID=UPI0012DFE64E|nr:hypothetical protein [Actinotalea ferrariae]